MGNSFECNKGKNKWLILSKIIKNVNDNKGKYKCKSHLIFEIILTEYVHLNEEKNQIIE